MKHTPRFLLPAAICLLVLAGAGLFAGPLDPPAGPIAPTPGPEPRTAVNATNTPGDANSLFKITQPGSYYLTGNITGVAGKHGIEIAASGVTLDLNGFDLAGVPGMGAFDGITAAANDLTNIAVLNGSVRNWGEDGVDLGDFGPGGSRVEGVRTSGNAARGLWVGSGATIVGCTATANGTVGIAASGSAIVTCSAFDNHGTGINAGSGSSVVNCSANFNKAAGFVASDACTITGCVARINVLDGFVVSSSCVLSGNAAHLNGNGGSGAGILATGSDNRIEANNCTDNDRGIDVNAAGNFIARNACSGNGVNYDIVANNAYGPIINRVGAATAAAVGSGTFASTLGTTDPNANYSY